MRFILSDELWVLDALSPSEWQLIRELPDIASGRHYHPAAKDRLFPSPLSEEVIADESTLMQVEDWDELIRPELEEAFAQARFAVEKDLKNCRLLAIEDFFEGDTYSDDEGTSEFEYDFPELYRIEVRHENTESWYSTLNQARLLMNEEYDIAGAEERFIAMTPGMPGYNEERMLLIAQYELFSVVQSILVENVMGE